MTSVTVEYEDLETIVFAAAAIKTIEGVLAQRKSDPFVKPHLDFTAAHNRLASAMRNSKRAEADTLVKWDGALTDEEIKLLRLLDEHAKSREAGVFAITRAEKAPKPGQSMSVADSLEAKGCVQMGTLASAVIWAGEDRPALTPDPKGFAIRITQRGQSKLAELGKASP